MDNYWIYSQLCVLPPLGLGSMEQGEDMEGDQRVLSPCPEHGFNAPAFSWHCVTIQSLAHCFPSHDHFLVRL